MSRFLAFMLVLALSGALFAQTREEKVRNDKKKVEAAGHWLYNDLPKAFEEARKTGKPIIAVLRCVPCEECVKLDDDLIDADERIKPLLEKFVRVRVVSTNGLDLSLFQFDTDQSFAVFFLNADGVVYGRFGTRSHRTQWVGDVSVEGLAKAMSGALALHAGYPENKSLLAARRGAAPEFARPELFPSLKARYTSTLDYKGKVAASCIHCHQIGDAIRDLTFSRKEKLPETTLFPYPHPRAIGLTLDPKEMATVLEVEPKSPAASGGFQVGDAIRSLGGQPLLSIADVQWVLHNLPAEGAELKAVVMRGGGSETLTLKLEAGWRRKDDIAWRASTWGLRRKALGGMFLVELPAEERKKLDMPADRMALLVQHVGQFAPHDVALRAGVRKGDVVVGFDGRTDFPRETDMIAYSLMHRSTGDAVLIDVLRGGKKQAIKMTLP